MDRLKASSSRVADIHKPAVVLLGPGNSAEVLGHIAVAHRTIYIRPAPSFYHCLEAVDIACCTDITIVQAPVAPIVVDNKELTTSGTSAIDNYSNRSRTLSLFLVLKRVGCYCY